MLHRHPFESLTSVPSHMCGEAVKPGFLLAARAAPARHTRRLGLATSTRMAGGTALLAAGCRALVTERAQRELLPVGDAGAAAGGTNHEQAQTLGTYVRLLVGLQIGNRPVDTVRSVLGHQFRTAARTGRAHVWQPVPPDLVLIPCRASVAGSSLDVCRVADVPAYVVLNAVPVQGRLADQARAAMAEHGAAVAPAMLCQRIAHVHAFTAGWSVMEYQAQSKATAESQPSTAGASTTEEPNERSIVSPQPCGRRPPRAPEPVPPRKGLWLRLEPAMHKRLRLLAVQEDTTVQQLGVEALEMLLQSRAG